MMITWEDRLLSSGRGQMTEKAARIVIAAVELFGEQGYAATSTREIARRAQVSEGCIFKHFSSKKDLLLHISRLIINTAILPIFDEGLSELFARPYDDVEEFISALLHNRLELIEGHIVLVKLLLQEAMFRQEIRQAFISAIMQGHFIRGIEYMKEQDLLPPLPAAELASLILTSFMGFIFSRYIMMPEMFTQNRQQDREQFARFLARGLGG